MFNWVKWNCKCAQPKPSVALWSGCPLQAAVDLDTGSAWANVPIISKTSRLWLKNTELVCLTAKDLGIYALGNGLKYTSFLFSSISFSWPPCCYFKNGHNRTLMGAFLGSIEVYYFKKVLLETMLEEWRCFLHFLKKRKKNTPGCFLSLSVFFNQL